MVQVSTIFNNLFSSISDEYFLDIYVLSAVDSETASDFPLENIQTSLVYYFYTALAWIPNNNTP